jgi:hypothetical protein
MPVIEESRLGMLCHVLASNLVILVAGGFRGFPVLYWHSAFHILRGLG